jgi:hypothetical protein
MRAPASSLTAPQPVSFITCAAERKATAGFPSSLPNGRATTTSARFVLRTTARHWLARSWGLRGQDMLVDQEHLAETQGHQRHHRHRRRAARSSGVRRTLREDMASPSTARTVGTPSVARGMSTSRTIRRMRVSCC